MKKLLKKRFIIPLILIGVLAFGPRASYPDFDTKLPQMAMSLAELETFVKQKDTNLPNLKPLNASSVVWADGLQKTAYSIVYLHGFSASQMEGDPIHREFAKRYGCNLYLPLLAGHGMEDDETFANISPKDWIDSAKEALMVGQLLGEKVILMSCSTGGTLSAWLAAQHPELVHSQIMYSPNIDLYDSKTALLTMPWGLQMARMVGGGDYFHSTLTGESLKYWNKTYRVEGAVALKKLIQQTMTNENFQKINQPLFIGAYYKNEEEQDKVVSVQRMREYFETVATPEDQKQFAEFPNVNSHVVTSGLQSEDLDDVRKKSFKFAEQVLQLKIVPNKKKISVASDEKFKTVDIAEINKKIAGRKDLSAEQVMRLYYPLKVAGQEGNQQIKVQSETLENGNTLVELQHLNQLDDSVNGVKYLMELIRKDDIWEVVALRNNFKCWEGRGHETWGIEPCN